MKLDLRAAKKKATSFAKSSVKSAKRKAAVASGTVQRVSKTGWDHTTTASVFAYKRTRVAATKASRKTRESFNHAWEQFKDSGEEFHDYVRSERFEKDLDELANRLGINDPKYFSRESIDWIRIQFKMKFIAENSGKEVIQATGQGALLGAALPEPITASLVAGIFGGAKGLLIAYHCYQVFGARDGLPEPTNA